MSLIIIVSETESIYSLLMKSSLGHKTRCHKIKRWIHYASEMKSALMNVFLVCVIGRFVPRWRLEHVILCVLPLVRTGFWNVQPSGSNYDVRSDEYTVHSGLSLVHVLKHASNSCSFPQVSRTLEIQPPSSESAITGHLILLG